MDEKYSQLRRKARHDLSLREETIRLGQKSGFISKLIAFPFQQDGTIFDYKYLYPCPYLIGQSLEDIKYTLYEMCLEPSSLPQWLIDSFGYLPDDPYHHPWHYPSPGVEMYHANYQGNQEARLEWVNREIIDGYELNIDGPTDPPFASIEDYCQDTQYNDMWKTSHALIMTLPTLEFIYPLLRMAWIADENEQENFPWGGLYQVLQNYALFVVDAGGVTWLDPPYPVDVNDLF
jgi:hypothetical protein